jgi:hypothetical protein
LHGSTSQPMSDVDATIASASGGGAAVAAAGVPGGAAFLQDPRNLRLGGAMGRPDIDPHVLASLDAAGRAALPVGYHAELTAGPANHTQGTYTGGAVSQVILGQAADIAIFDAQGNRIPNPVDRGAGDPGFDIYKRVGDEYIKQRAALFHERGRWGGYYGRPDRMQFGTVSEGYPAGANDPYGAGIPPVETAANRLIRQQHEIAAGHTPGQTSALEPGDNDTSHHVEISLGNAPPGTRIVRQTAQGPADLAVRVHGSMPQVA